MPTVSLCGSFWLLRCGRHMHARACVCTRAHTHACLHRQKLFPLLPGAYLCSLCLCVPSLSMLSVSLCVPSLPMLSVSLCMPTVRAHSACPRSPPSLLSVSPSFQGSDLLYELCFPPWGVLVCSVLPWLVSQPSACPWEQEFLHTSCSQWLHSALLSPASLCCLLHASHLVPHLLVCPLSASTLSRDACVAENCDMNPSLLLTLLIVAHFIPLAPSPGGAGLPKIITPQAGGRGLPKGSSPFQEP